jgi:hypothetical protein
MPRRSRLSGFFDFLQVAAAPATTFCPENYGLQKRTRQLGCLNIHASAVKL